MLDMLLLALLLAFCILTWGLILLCERLARVTQRVDLNGSSAKQGGRPL